MMTSDSASQMMTRKLLASLTAGLLAVLGMAGVTKADLPVPERGFVSATPAATWEEGLISGNGTIGTNVLSRPEDEIIIFTHERMFLPTGEPTVPPDTGARLSEVRRLLDRGQWKQATSHAFELSGQEDFLYPDPFVPCFDLRITMPADGQVKDYARSVDFQTGVATVHWADDRSVFERRVFVSRADGVAALVITGSQPGSIDCSLELTPRTLSPNLDAKVIEQSNARFQDNITDIKVTADPQYLTFSNRFARSYRGSIQRMEGAARVVATGGEVSADRSVMSIKGADQVLVLIVLGPAYELDRSQMDEHKAMLARLPADFGALLKRHARIHGEIFNRVRLDLGGSDEDHARTTEELLELSTNENLSVALTEKVFDAARYNIISCTGELPPTLQGVWAGTYAPPWASDFTHNGNVPSAIAANMRGNMPELMLAYTSYIESIVPYLRVNAKHIFGARGLVLPSRSTTHGYNNALAPTFAGGMWVAGAPWAAHFFYDYYLYTGDKAFLANHAMPFMQETSLFFEDFLYQGPDGKYVFSPSTSPENFPSNTKTQAAINSTMDISAFRELTTNLIAGSKELGINQERIPQWQEMLTKLPDYMLSEKEGVVKEWSTPRLDEALDHRHSSHLYALYDGMSPDLVDKPQLLQGFRKIVEIKLENHYKKAGFMSFGVVQLGQAATSLGEGELAYAAMVRLVNSYWLGNLASMHNHRSLFNMDISGGLPAVLIKMLVASSPGKVSLIPALPKAWPSGMIQGALCRGQIELEKLQWETGRVRATLRSAKEQTVELSVPGKIVMIGVADGQAAIARTGNDHTRKVTLPKGTSVTFEIAYD